MANALQHESSPYLLQHKDNPVDWQPWGPAALERAQAENKPMIISIGYSACHWCHVMEHESFEDPDVAAVMNAHFICIKVDREERPDIDQVYMDAVQLMTGQGGWPLNCFALPDGRPFFGGTYFQKERWIGTLQNVHAAFQDRYDDLIEYANKLTSGLNEMDELPVRRVPEQFTDESVETAIARWKKRFDNKEGGAQGAPKFPLPNNYECLLHFSVTEDDMEVRDHVLLTLRKMAWGGIYDHIGGGFTRYSTDAIWKVPHFEKMLYDNGQLLSLYAHAYLYFKDAEFQRTIKEICGFLLREMRTEQGTFFSALDADSEGEEGKFYIWKPEELREISGDDYPIIETVYGLKGSAHWEEDKWIPFQQDSIELLARKLELDTEMLNNKLSQFKETALADRSKRVRPGLDDKVLTSWNAMTVHGLASAYQATQEASYLKAATTALEHLLNHWESKQRLPHTVKKDGTAINGYLEDYAHTAWAALKCYEVSFDERWVGFARDLAAQVMKHFSRNDSGFFYFTSDEDEALVARKVEINDNVIPASNSIMASVLFYLSRLDGNQAYAQIVREQLANVEPQFTSYPAGYSQWLRLLLWHAEPFYEVAILGGDCEQVRHHLFQHYMPNALICGSEKPSELSVLQDRYQAGKTLVYVCRDGVCRLPVETVEDALAQLQ
jgi:hypothetical protein